MRSLGYILLGLFLLTAGLLNTSEAMAQPYISAMKLTEKFQDESWRFGYTKPRNTADLSVIQSSIISSEGYNLVIYKLGWRGDSEAFAALGTDFYVAQLWGPPNRIIEEYGGHHYIGGDIVETQDGLVGLYVYTNLQGGSAISAHMIFYSTAPKISRVGSVLSPLNQWQSSRGSGSEKYPAPLYHDARGNLYVDAIVFDYKPSACNACDTVNVETLKITKNGLVKVATRNFNLLSYQPYQPAANPIARMFQQLDIVTTEVVQGFWEGVFHLSYDLWFALGEVRLWFDLLLVETFAEDSVEAN